MRIFKRFTAIALTAVMLFSLSANAFAVQGDIDADGKLKMADMKLILQIASGEIIPTEEQLLLADCNGDGVVSTDDILVMMEQCEDYDPLMFMGEVSQITPEKKNTSSAKKTKICKIKSYCAESKPNSSMSSASNPLYTVLPKGTYDFILSGPHKETDHSNKYYKLKSGRRVLTTDVTVLDGYTMPNNNARLYEAAEYNNSCTNLFIALDWRVPFNVTVKPQEYESGYEGKKYNVKDGKFTATYMDITFYYTTSADGVLSFPESETIKNCKWIINSDKKTATLRVYLNKKGGFYGYKAYYDENNYLVISIKEPTDTLKGRVIMLDPGHGGVDSGALSQTGYYEKNITWPIANKLKKLLEKQGATVILTRGNTSKEPTIQERRLKAIKENPDMYVAIHTDASTSHGAKGCSVYYYKNHSAPLAFSILDELPKAIKGGAGYSMSDRGANFYAFHVTRVENCPSVLVECGFISNTNEFNMMKSSKGQDAIAKGLYNGIVDYFGI